MIYVLAFLLMVCVLLIAWISIILRRSMRISYVVAGLLDSLIREVEPEYTAGEMKAWITDQKEPPASTSSGPISNAERCRRYRERKGDAYREANKLRMRERRK